MINLSSWKFLKEHWLDSHLKLDESADTLNLAKIIREKIKIKPISEPKKQSSIEPANSEPEPKNVTNYQNRPINRKPPQKPPIQPSVATVVKPVITTLPLNQTTTMQPAILPMSGTSLAPTFYTIGGNGQLIPVAGFSSSQLIPVTTFQPNPTVTTTPVQPAQTPVLPVQPPLQSVQIRVQNKPDPGDQKTIALTLDSSKLIPSSKINSEIEVPEKIVVQKKSPKKLNKAKEKDPEWKPGGNFPELEDISEKTSKLDEEPESCAKPSGKPEGSQKSLQISDTNETIESDTENDTKDRSDDDQPVIMQIESIQSGSANFVCELCESDFPARV